MTSSQYNPILTTINLLCLRSCGYVSSIEKLHIGAGQTHCVRVTTFVFLYPRDHRFVFSRSAWNMNNIPLTALKTIHHSNLYIKGCSRKSFIKNDKTPSGRQEVTKLLI